MQDGVLTSASKILNRMIELKGLSSDVMKNSSDQENYNREFQDLQMQMYDLANLKFNGVSLFATTSTSGGTGTFSNMNQVTTDRNVVVVNVSADGTSGPQVSVNKALLLSALTIDTDSLGTGVAASDTTNSAGAGNLLSLHQIMLKLMHWICGISPWEFFNRQLRISQLFAQIMVGLCPGFALPLRMCLCKKPT